MILILLVLFVLFLITGTHFYWLNNLSNENENFICRLNGFRDRLSHIHEDLLDMKSSPEAEKVEQVKSIAQASVTEALRNLKDIELLKERVVQLERQKKNQNKDLSKKDKKPVVELDRSDDPIVSFEAIGKKIHKMRTMIDEKKDNND